MHIPGVCIIHSPGFLLVSQLIFHRSLKSLNFQPEAVWEGKSPQKETLYKKTMMHPRDVFFSHFPWGSIEYSDACGGFGGRRLLLLAAVARLSIDALNWIRR